MVTAEEVYDNELKFFCQKFGFSFSNHLVRKVAKKEVVLMHAIVSVPDYFYKKYLKKSYSLEDARKILLPKTKNHLDHVSGGSGILNWTEWHDLVYQAFRSLSSDQADAILRFPDLMNIVELKNKLGKLGRYVPEYINVLKIIAYMKYVNVDWAGYFEELKITCEDFKKFESSKSKILPWFWHGKIDSSQHAAILHESIHNILENSGINSTFDHNAWREGVDVFLHRRSSLHLGYYRKKFWYQLFKKDLINYWNASEIFWDVLKDVEDLKLRGILSSANNEKTKMIISQIKNIWPHSSKFHSD